MIKRIRKILSKSFPFIDNETNRIEWVKNTLRRIPKNESILDAGAGECQYKKYCSHLKYTSQDFGQYDGLGDGVGMQTNTWDNSQLDIISDIINIPVESCSFDNVLCTEVLEHLPRPDLAIVELSRVLKKGGRLILTAPFCSQTHFAPYHYHTGFNRYWYEKMFMCNDIDLVVIETNGDYYDYINQELIRIPIMLNRKIGFISMLTYIVILPLVGIIELISLIDKNTSNQLCFGYHVIGIKK